LQLLCKDIAEKFRLPAGENRKLLESALSESLTEAFGKKVIVFLSGDSLSIYLATGRNGSVILKRLPPGLLRKDLVRRCRYCVERELERRKTIIEFGFLKSLRGTAVKGVVDRVRKDGSLSVLFYLDELFDYREIAGTCPVSQQPTEERGLYAPGDCHYFFVSKVLLVGREKALKIDVRLSRTSMRLPELLLKMKSGIGEIRCVKRIAGCISIVTAPKKLPREAILAVSAELGERVRVIWGSRAGSERKRMRAKQPPTWDWASI